MWTCVCALPEGSEPTPAGQYLQMSGSLAGMTLTHNVSLSEVKTNKHSPQTEWLLVLARVSPTHNNFRPYYVTYALTLF